MSSARHTPVTSLTGARTRHSEDRRSRFRRYVIMMSIRVVCLLLAALLPIPLWAVGVLLVGAILLPWLAVQAANGGTVEPERGPDARLAAEPDLEALQLTTADAHQNAVVDVVDGVVVDVEER